MHTELAAENVLLHPYTAPGAPAQPAGHKTVAGVAALPPARSAWMSTLSESRTESAHDIVGMAVETRINET